MSNELTPQEFNVIKDYAEGLKEVFQNYKENHRDNLTDCIFNYVTQVIDIHLALKELEVERYIFNLKKSLDK